MNTKTRQKLDLFSPIFSAIGSFIGSVIFMLAYQFIFISDVRFVDFYNGKEYFLVFCMYALILPVIFAYSLCPCTCYFKGLVALSYGSLGGAFGAFLSFMIFIGMLYIGIFIASSLLLLAPIMSGIFSYLFHRAASNWNNHAGLDNKGLANEGLGTYEFYYHPMTYQFYQYPLDYISKNPVSL
ncbi:MAG: hypothetical protein QXT63_03400 [Thermoplasmata archaeon]